MTCRRISTTPTTPRDPDHAAAHRLREDRRRLRLQLRLLHHPDAARPVSQPLGRVDRRRGAPARRPRRPRAAPHLAGLHLLRRRSPRARRPRPAAARARHGRRPALGPAALPLPDDHHRRDDRRHRRLDEGRALHRSAAPARGGHHAEADAAARLARQLRAAAARPARAPPRCHAAHHVRGRLPRRDRGGVRGAGRLREDRRVRPRRRLHLLARGRHGGLRDGRRRAGAGEDRSASAG